MKTPKVSVIIPTYKGREHLGEAIQSVLDQTYQDFEILVVNDASPDDTADVMTKFNDPRIQYIVHERNLGVGQARRTGIQASRGELLVFLDQDDYFHPEKLALHASFHEQHPEMGFTYNARFELNFSAKTIRTIWRPPQNITLADLVLWFPTAPSEWVLRREWANKLVDLIEISQIWTGGEIVYLGNLFLSGCKFGLVDRVLNYRRHHSRRVFKDLSGGCRCEILAQEIIFNDPRCPEDVLALRDTAHSNIYAFWAVIAFFQNETSLGQSFLRQAVHHRPDILAGNPCDLVDKFLVGNCSDDENEDYPTLLKKVFDQLPPEMALISEQFDWALARGFLLRGARAAIWDRPEDAQKYFQLAREMNAEVDDSFLSHLTRSLMDYEKEFGSYSAQQILKNIESYLQDMTDTRDLQQLKGLFAMNYAFQCYQTGEYRKVPKQVLKAFLIDSRNVYNRGLHSVLFRSIIKSLSLKNSKEALEVYSYHTQ